MTITNIYHKRYVLFIDILGFKELIKKGKAQEVYVALEASGNLASSTSGSDFFDFKSAVFSDCVVMSQVFDNDRLEHAKSNEQHVLENFIKRAGELFWRFMQCGVLVRGGITYGDMHHEAHRVFGPALVEAYELENSRAIYPRIILSGSVYEKFQVNESKNALTSLIRTDADGEKYINVMDSFYIPEPSMNSNPIDSNLHKDYLYAFKKRCVDRYIKENEDTEFPRVKQKINWLKTYIKSPPPDHPLGTL